MFLGRQSLTDNGILQPLVPHLQQLRWLKLCTEHENSIHSSVEDDPSREMQAVRQWLHQHLPLAVVQIENETG